MWYFVTLAGVVTHRDAASTACSLAFARLLWDLLLQPDPPGPHYYYQNFLETLQDVEHDTPYEAKTPRFDGWKGRLSKFLQQTIPDARRRGLSVAQAHQEWGSSSYLLESIPTLLYILENHAHQPQEALRLATQGTSDPSGLGALVGAAMGALHGRLDNFPLEGKLAEELDRISKL
jgi:ADP-ribosylglycohydrolase